jgi:hypothetical protein
MPCCAANGRHCEECFALLSASGGLVARIQAPPAKIIGEESFDGWWPGHAFDYERGAARTVQRPFAAFVHAQVRAVVGMLTLPGVGDSSDNGALHASVRP